MTNMLYEKQASGTIDDVVVKIQEAAAANKFGVLGVHDLKEKMTAKGISFGPECRILEVCNPAKAKAVLEADMSISNALPCRISVFEREGKITVSMLRPTYLLGLFNRPELQPVAKEVEDSMLQIIDTTCQ